MFKNIKSWDKFKMWDAYALFKVRDLIKYSMSRGLCFYSVYEKTDLEEIEYEIKRRGLIE